MQDSKHRRESYRGPREVSNVLDAVMETTIKMRGFTQAAVITQWRAIIGEDWAGKCVPIKLVFPQANRSEGTLHIRAPGSVAIELQHLEPVLVERINRYFGFRAVDRFSLSQSPMSKEQTLSGKALAPLAGVEEAKLNATVSGVVDAGLRNALIDLGRGVIQNNSARRTSEA